MSDVCICLCAKYVLNFWSVFFTERKLISGMLQIKNFEAHIGVLRNGGEKIIIVSRTRKVEKGTVWFSVLTSATCVPRW